MPTLTVPNSACFHTFKNFLSMNAPFVDKNSPAILDLDPRFAHLDPMALSMVAAWGGWCKRNGLVVEVQNAHGNHVNYLARMKLFQHLNVSYATAIREREEAGRFMPLIQVKTTADLQSVIGNVSAVLHLDKDTNSLSAVQYCVSELVRNVLEHSNSDEGAWVCAQRYSTHDSPSRVTIAVADCGYGIAAHLSNRYPQVRHDDMMALQFAMQPGVTGAQSGQYGGAPNNAGAGLFITRAIAKATGGYFALISGRAAFRLNREKPKTHAPHALTIFHNAFNEPNVKRCLQDAPWIGTVAAMEINTERTANFPDLFQWIRQQLPTKKTAAGKIKFT